jgi:predicted GIY-YIG superfamily endonuclease
VGWRQRATASGEAVSANNIAIVTEKELNVVSEFDMAQKSPRRWWVYVLQCSDRSLYTGVTTDVSRRVRQHNAGTASKYTRSRRPVTVVYREIAAERGKALKREAAIKRLARPAKVSLIADTRK